MPTVAIVGASTDHSKFGNKAVRAYLLKGWTIYPVNPSASEIEGLKVYRSVRDLPRPIDRVSVYLPPQVGVNILEDLAAVSPGEIFLNPGSESDSLVERARQLGLNIVFACSIVDIGVRPASLG